MRGRPLATLLPFLKGAPKVVSAPPSPGSTLMRMKKYRPSSRGKSTPGVSGACTRHPHKMAVLTLSSMAQRSKVASVSLGGLLPPRPTAPPLAWESPSLPPVGGEGRPIPGAFRETRISFIHCIQRNKEAGHCFWSGSEPKRISFEKSDCAQKEH